MAPYEALYGMRCISPVGWFKPGEARLLGIDLVQDALDKVKLVQERFRMAQSRQKGYADRKVRDVSFMVGEKVLLKVQKLRSKDIASVKLQWRGQPVEEATWETKREIRSRYLCLFETPSIFLDLFEDERLFKRERM
ncbi:uncharacterized protein [Nicotiana tomentosiformis]|uniref:uncharacterized protein n=1 Tax=Nicotiana tomentosiformis TaxID=4098 RepID=UPI00388C7AB6